MPGFWWCHNTHNTHIYIYIHFANLFMYELSPVPPSLIDEYDGMGKASLYKPFLKVEVFTDTQLLLFATTRSVVKHGFCCRGS